MVFFHFESPKLSRAGGRGGQRCLIEWKGHFQCNMISNPKEYVSYQTPSVRNKKKYCWFEKYCSIVPHFRCFYSQSICRFFRKPHAISKTKEIGFKFEIAGEKFYFILWSSILIYREVTSKRAVASASATIIVRKQCLVPTQWTTRDVLFDESDNIVYFKVMIQIILWFCNYVLSPIRSIFVRHRYVRNDT